MFFGEIVIEFVEEIRAPHERDRGSGVYEVGDWEGSGPLDNQLVRQDSMDPAEDLSLIEVRIIWFMVGMQMR